MDSQISIAIPGTWQDRSSTISALEKIYAQNYSLAGGIFLEIATARSCIIQIGDRDSYLANEFEVAGQGSISESTLAKLELHRQVVYLIFPDVGYQTCLTAARFAKVFLDIGGIAIKVNSTQIAHEKDIWLEKYDSQDVFDIYSLFVILSCDNDYFFSRGMNNFGKADVSIDIREDIHLAWYVINVFNYYRLTEFPILKTGQTFRPDLDSPVYELEWIKAGLSELNDLSSNYYGRWHLSRI